MTTTKSLVNIGDLVAYSYTKLSGLHSPRGLVLKLQYDPGELEWPGGWTCLVQFTDGERAWVNERNLMVISTA